MGRELSLWACIDYAVSGGHTFNLSPFIRSSIITTGAIKKKKEKRSLLKGKQVHGRMEFFADLTVVIKSTFLAR